MVLSNNSKILNNFHITIIGVIILAGIIRIIKIKTVESSLGVRQGA